MSGRKNVPWGFTRFITVDLGLHSSYSQAAHWCWLRLTILPDFLLNQGGGWLHFVFNDLSWEIESYS